MSRSKLIRRGNIIRKSYKVGETGCYLGNGRFGAVMSGLGLNMSPQMQRRYPAAGQSQYTHMEHWGRFRFISEAMNQETTADYILPLFKIYWEQEPEHVEDYRQCQDFYDGTLETSYRIPAAGAGQGTQIKVLNWFDQANKNLAGIHIDISEGTVPVKVSAVTDFVPYAFLYKKMTHQNVAVKKAGDNWCVKVVCEDTINQTCTDVYIYSTARAELCSDGIRLLASKGNNQIYISAGCPVTAEDVRQSLERTREKWHENWETGGWFDFPEETAQKMWIRSWAYLLSSYDDDLGIIQPANGLTGNMFPFHFVQDMEYMSPALMMMGRVDIVKRWIEKFAGEIEEMRQYAKSLWPEAKGIYPPWELPYGPIEGYHSPSVPVIFCYEPHNAGYLCRMAREAADFIGEETWTERYVYPLVLEISRFYEAFCRKREDGLWHLEWYPCVGQDEAGGRNRRDYLCSLYSAQYSFQTAVAYGLDKDGRYAEILKDGLAFKNLLSDRGILHTAHGTDDFGKQKHPVQLDGLAYFPIETAPLEYEKKAYELRHDITDRAKEPFYFGWTLGQFLLAGSNNKDAEGWRRDWAEMRTSDYTDEEWIQIYETSGEAEKSFYMTAHGMVLQSLIRNYVNDYWGTLDIGSCPVFEQKVSFGNIETRLGITVSGSVGDHKIRVELNTKRQCECIVNDELISLEPGKNIYETIK